MLAYIGRYMKRGPIALNRIKIYDGEQVAFSYYDKRTNQDPLSKNRVNLPEESEKNLIQCQANDAGKKLARTNDRTIQEKSVGMSLLWQLLCIQGDGCAQKWKVKGRIANGKEAHVYLVKEIGRLEEEAYQYEQKEAEETLFKAIRFDWHTLYRSINERERELYLSIV